MKYSFMFLSSIFLLCSGCDDNKNEPVFKPATDNYLPLAVGNEWHFNQSGMVGTGDVARKVVSQKVVDGHNYFLLITLANCNTCDPRPDSLYMRVDDTNGYVYSRRPRITWDDNWFRLNAKDKDTWSYVIDTDDKATITTSEVKITLGTTEMPDCKAYYYDVERWADEEYTRTLAKGVGFVKEYSNAWGGSFTLTSATIDGKTILFK